jgi:hypothetical protein
MAAAALAQTSMAMPRGVPRAPTTARVSLRTLKAAADRLPLTHPLRVVLSGEPDEIPKEEYAIKAPGWFRLLLVKAE